MSKPISKRQICSYLAEYLQIKEEMKELESRENELKQILFSSENVGNLPDTFEINYSSYEKQIRAATVPVTIAMLSEVGLDLNMIVPMAKFSMTACKQVYGVSGEKKLKNSPLFQLERDAAGVSVFYKKK